MELRKLAHYAVRAPDLAASRRFYVDVLGLREGFRPPFPFAGAWLYLDGDEADYGVVHLIGEGDGLGAYLGERTGEGRSSIDHIAFLATGWPAMRARCLQMGIPFEERTVPQLRLHQAFLTDPSGVVVELNFPPEEVR